MKHIGKVEVVAIPPKYQPKGELAIALLSMQVGESRLILGYSRNNAYMTASRCNIVIKTALEGEGFRVWRRA